MGVYQQIRKQFPNLEPGNISRSAEMEKLKDMLGRLKDPLSDSGVFLIHGNSGMGKSTFLEEICDEYALSEDYHVA